MTLALSNRRVGARATAGQQFEEPLFYGLFIGFGWWITWKQPITAQIQTQIEWPTQWTPCENQSQTTTIQILTITCPCNLEQENEFADLVLNQ